MRKLCFFVIVMFLAFLPKEIAAENKEGDLIIVNKAVNKLAFYKKGEFVNEYPVATGRTKSLTPEGTFTVVNRIKNRPYYKEKIPGGSPLNPLGDRWLGLDVPGTWGHTYGIHGTNNEYSIGKYASSGCIRMYNDDVRELFEQVGHKAEVIVTHTEKAFDELVIEHGYDLKTEVETTPIYALLEVLEPIPLYSEPNKYYQLNIGLLPQTITTLKQTEGYYYVEAWFGEAWVRADDVIPSPPASPGTYEHISEKEAIITDNPLSLMQYGMYYHNSSNE